MKLELTFPAIIKEVIKMKYNFNKANFVGINNYLLNVDWNVMRNLCSTDVDSCVNFFYDKITFAFDLFVPLSPVKSTNHPPWYTKNILNLKNRKNKVHKRFIKSILNATCTSYEN